MPEVINYRHDEKLSKSKNIAIKKRRIYGIITGDIGHCRGMELDIRIILAG